MNQKIWSSLSVTLLMTTLGTATAQAQQSREIEPASQISSPAVREQQTTEKATLASAKPQAHSPITTGVQQVEVIAKIQAYESAGRPVAILYVRDIPVLTFIEGSRPTKTASRQPSSPDTALKFQEQQELERYSTASDGLDIENNAVWRATAVAAKLNQLYRDKVDANAIAVRWNAQDKAFSIDVNGQELVQVNETTFLADTTRNLAQDALQATNRFRRLLGNATPLGQIIGMPKKRSTPQVAARSVRSQFQGIASWYGPGFHGRRSASGERYNQNAMTAAHRSLPFGTEVVVTNLNNGRSVVVRINDRGPFVRGRVIDLSAAAARALGVMQAGTAPVQIQVLGKPQTVASETN